MNTITTATVAQDIEVGPVRVDTGNDWMDLGFVLLLLIVIVGLWKWSGFKFT
jgi:hypothetical protein